MNKIEYHAMIKFLTKEGKTQRTVVYNDTAPSYSTVTRWRKEFCHSLESLEDDPCAGRNSKAASEDTADCVEAMIIENQQVKVEEISLEIEISHGSV